MENYVKGAVLGVGTFGEVWKATHKQTGQVVAIKKIKLGDAKEGVNVTALREIKILRELSPHPYIINLIDTFPRKKSILLVFEFMASDLEAVIKDKSLVLSTADVKSYFQMLLRGLAVCHGKWVIHRDMKPNNCLIAPDGTLKLADFGLSRLLLSPERGRPYTNQVFARWYRSPELLYGSTCYGFAPDIWAAGCVLAELMLRRPWFPGDTDIDQLGKVFQALGTPTEKDWPGVTQLPNYLEYQPVQAPPLKALFPKEGEDALDLLSKMVCLNPANRISAKQALAHRYFTSEPLPTLPSRLPRPVPREEEPLNNAPLPSIKIARPSNYPGTSSPRRMTLLGCCFGGVARSQQSPSSIDAPHAAAAAAAHAPAGDSRARDEAAPAAEQAVGGNAQSLSQLERRAGSPTASQSPAGMGAMATSRAQEQHHIIPKTPLSSGDYDLEVPISPSRVVPSLAPTPPRQLQPILTGPATLPSSVDPRSRMIHDAWSEGRDPYSQGTPGSTPQHLPTQSSNAAQASGSGTPSRPYTSVRSPYGRPQQPDIILPMQAAQQAHALASMECGLGAELGMGVPHSSHSTGRVPRASTPDLMTSVRDLSTFTASLQLGIDPTLAARWANLGRSRASASVTDSHVAAPGQSGSHTSQHQPGPSGKVQLQRGSSRGTWHGALLPSASGNLHSGSERSTSGNLQRHLTPYSSSLLQGPAGSVYNRSTYGSSLAHATSAASELRSSLFDPSLLPQGGTRQQLMQLILSLESGGSGQAAHSWSSLSPSQGARPSGMMAVGSPPGTRVRPGAPSLHQRSSMPSITALASMQAGATAAVVGSPPMGARRLRSTVSMPHTRSPLRSDNAAGGQVLSPAASSGAAAKTTASGAAVGSAGGLGSQRMLSGVATGYTGSAGGSPRLNRHSRLSMGAVSSRGGDESPQSGC